MRSLLLAGLSLALAAVPAAASISTVDFHGYGRVTNVNVSDPFLGPSVLGAPVRISGRLMLGPAAVPNGYTGTVVFDDDALYNNLQNYSWTVDGGRSGGLTNGFAYAGGSASFVAGRLTAVSVYIDYDGDIEELYPTRWAATFPYNDDSSWGGSWVLSVPEPASWAMMIAGFGVAGLGLRRNRAPRLPT